MEIPGSPATLNLLYLALNALHVLAVALFLGSLVLGAFWKVRADRTGDPRIIAYTLDGIVRAHRWLTMPAVVLLVLLGFAMIEVGNVSLSFSWIILGMVMAAISILALLLRVAPLQQRMLGLARSAGEAGPFDRAGYERLTDRWRVWLMIATAPPVVAVALMVFKPR